MTHVVYVPVGGARTDERLLVVFDTSTPVGGPLRLVDVADDALVRSCSSLCAGCTPTIRPTTPGRYRRARRRGVRPLVLVEHVVGCPAAAQAVRVVAGRMRAATSVSRPRVTKAAS